MSWPGGAVEFIVIAVGGGSVMDAGKAIARHAGKRWCVVGLRQVIGRGKALTKPSCPFIAIPTTAGTGAEVTQCGARGARATGES